MSAWSMDHCDKWSNRIYLRLRPKDIAALKFLLEANDNLAYLSTVSPYTAVARLVYAPDQEGEIREFLDSVALEVSWVEVWKTQGSRSRIPKKKAD